MKESVKRKILQCKGLKKGGEKVLGFRKRDTGMSYSLKRRGTWQSEQKLEKTVLLPIAT